MLIKLQYKCFYKESLSTDRIATDRPKIILIGHKIMFDQFFDQLLHLVKTDWVIWSAAFWWVSPAHLQGHFNNFGKMSTNLIFFRLLEIFTNLLEIFWPTHPTQSFPLNLPHHVNSLLFYYFVFITWTVFRKKLQLLRR